MNFSEKLKTKRKQFKFSQEQLAEKIGVSRQAITKWETGGGLPDIENLMAISTLFSISMDDLLSEEKLARDAFHYPYKSVTEYDISRLTHFDIHAPGALEIIVTAAENEKLHIQLTSNALQNLAQDYKVKLDEGRNRLDVDIRRTGQSSEAEGKEALFVHISLPSRYTKEVELSAVSDVLRLCGTDFPFEFDGKVCAVHLESVKNTVTLNCNIDMEITADEIPSTIEINQINAASILRVPSDAKYFTKIKGKSNTIRLTVDGKPAELPAGTAAEHCIELAGMNAELRIEQAGRQNDGI